MNKIGILTFHNADNLGAVLQAYALQSVLENECGAEVDIIDYKCEAIEKSKYVEHNRDIKGVIKYLALSIYYFIKRKEFDRFRKKYLNLSKPYIKSTIHESVGIYDKFIAGSDQIWNFECSGDDYTYYLDFIEDSNKKFSYAASIGNYIYKNEEIDYIGNLLNSFEQVSIRERSAMDTYKRMGVEKIRIDTDPTLLLSIEQWKRIISNRIYKKRYVLVYLIQQDVNVMRAAEKYAKKHNCKIISNKRSIEFILRNSPSDFLSWIYYAECIFTNSFHGTAFSLIFNKKLGADVELIDGRINSRINDLLSATNAEQCIIKKNSLDAECANAEQYLKEATRESMEYLNAICCD